MTLYSLPIYSGDFLSPSDISTVTKGQHMIPVMNSFGITCGMIGNHEFDYGNTHCIEMIKKLNYPVLNTNIFTPTNGVASGKTPPTEEDLKLDMDPIGKCVKSYVYKYSDNINIGFVGVSENWCYTLPIKPENGLIYLDHIEVCQKAVNELKKENKIDFMIVLTHSRLLNDQDLASKIEGVDLICGGMFYVSIIIR